VLLRAGQWWPAARCSRFAPHKENRNMIARMSVLSLVVCGLLAGLVAANRDSLHASSASRPEANLAAAQSISGDYVEIRSCDVYTGPCFANGEMNVGGKEAILAWAVRSGGVDGVDLTGLNVIAVVKAENTLGDVSRFPEPAKSVLIVDEKASPAQREALVRFVQDKAGRVLGDTVRIESSPMKVQLPPTCSSAGCSNVVAGDLVQIETRCLGGADHVCGNEELFYPPLTAVSGARPAYTMAAVFHGDGLGTQFDEANRRSAYLATFTD
jgi:hypothetical protein